MKMCVAQALEQINVIFTSLFCYAGDAFAAAAALVFITIHPHASLCCSATVLNVNVEDYFVVASVDVTVAWVLFFHLLSFFLSFCVCVKKRIRNTYIRRKEETLRV